MPTANSIIERVLSKIDHDELVQLVMALTKLDSPTRREQKIAEAQEAKKLKAKKQPPE